MMTLRQPLEPFQRMPEELRSLFSENCCPFILSARPVGFKVVPLMLITEIRDGIAWGFLLHDVKAIEPTILNYIKVAQRVGRIRTELSTDEEREILDDYEQQHSVGVFKFSKYKGQRVEDIMRSDPGFVIWANNKVDSFREQINSAMSAIRNPIIWTEETIKIK